MTFIGRSSYLQCWELSRQFIAILYRDKLFVIVLSRQKNPLLLSIYRYRDTFVPKGISDNKIQQVIEKQFHT